MNAADRRALERELGEVRRLVVACGAEMEGQARAAAWADAFEEPVIYDRAIGLAHGSEESVAYYQARAEAIADDLAQADTDADHRARDREIGDSLRGLS